MLLILLLVLLALIILGVGFTAHVLWLALIILAVVALVLYVSEHARL